MKNIFKKLALYSATIGLLSILLVSCKEEIPFTVDKHEYISYNELVTNQQIGCVVKNSSFIAYSTSIPDSLSISDFETLIILENSELYTAKLKDFYDI